jgi:hypothetical protein
VHDSVNARKSIHEVAKNILFEELEKYKNELEQKKINI